jgi:hypothetical protein
VVRYLDADNDRVTGWVRAAAKFAPFVDDGVRKVLRQHVKEDKHPVVAVLLLAAFDEPDAIRPALESAYPLAREAARKALKSGMIPKS